MAKNMARIENNIVINIEWCSDETIESEELIDVFDRSVEIGDTYENGKFYRNGEEVLTFLEEILIQNEEYYNKQLELDISYQEGINSI